jgi:hypothetical protein
MLSVDDERALTSYHESGHAVMALALGGLISGPCSISPSRLWKGVAHVRARGFSPRDAESIRVGRGILAYPARVRRSLESDVIISLAGHESEQYRPHTIAVEGYVGESPRLAETIEKFALAPLTRADAKLLARGDLDEPLPNDVMRAFASVERLVAGERRVWALIRFLAEETAELVAGEVFQRRLHRLAAALLEHETLGARAVREVLADA